MYQRDKLGQEETVIDVPSYGEFTMWPEGQSLLTTPPESSFFSTYGNYEAATPGSPDAGMPQIYNLAPNQTLPPAETTSSWSWDWLKPVGDIVRFGAEAFSKIYPAVKGTQSTGLYTAGGQAKMPQQAPAGYYYTSTGALARVPAGYAVDPRTGQLIAQAGIATSPYFWPLVIGAGALLLLSGKPKGGR